MKTFFKKNEFTLLLFIVCTIPALVLSGYNTASAGYLTGYIYCDENNNNQLDLDTDIPLSDVVVNVSSITDPFSDTGVTDAGGQFTISIPWDVEGPFVETLDPTTLPPNVTFIDPATNEHQFPTPAECRAWLLECEPVQPDACRVTAGGNKTGFTVPCELKPNGLPDTSTCASYGPDTWGGQAGAPPRIDGNWTHHHKPSSKQSFVFHSNNLFSITCSDPGDFCAPARYAPNRQIDFSGIGRFSNQKGFSFPSGDLCFDVHLEDTGEPGPGGKKKHGTGVCDHCPGTPIINATDCPDCTDYYMIKIYGNSLCTGEPVYVNGPGVPENCTGANDPQLKGYFTDKGNVQMHPDNNGP